MTRRAFVDESYAQLTSHYLMAAVVLDDTTSQGVSDLARGLRRRASGAFHWRHELDASRRTMLDLIALVSDAQWWWSASRCRAAGRSVPAPGAPSRYWANYRLCYRQSATSSSRAEATFSTNGTPTGSKG